MNRKKEAKSPEQVNYTLSNPDKITFEFLKSYLWSDGRYSQRILNSSDYRQPIMTLLFLKRLNDTFEENAEKLVKQGKSEKEAYGNKNRHRFFVPKDVTNMVQSR